MTVLELVNKVSLAENRSAPRYRTDHKFEEQDKHFCRYYDGIYILFKIVLSIFGFVGSIPSDVDMQDRKINVNCRSQAA